MRAWFHSRNRREQLLVTVFVGLGSLIWLTGATSRLRAQWDTWRSTQGDRATQQLWLDRREEIEAASAAAVRNLDPARTHDATRLVATVNSLAGGAGLQPAIEPAVTQRTPQFAYHTIKVTFRRTQLSTLLKFYDELTNQAPYLNLESMVLQSDRAAAGTLNATLQISATQIVTP